MNQPKRIDNKKLIVFLLLVFAGIAGSNCQTSDFLYKLSYARDIPLLSATFSYSAVKFYLDKNLKIDYLTYDEVEKLDIHDIPRFDRSVTKNWSPELADRSDVTKNIVKASPVLIVLPQLAEGKWKNILVLGVMYLEGSSLSGNITEITKDLTLRKRPYLYNNTTISPAEKKSLCAPGNDYTYTSFYSGHTSESFFAAVFLSKVVTDIYGKSTLTYFVWGTTLFGAATTGYLRYKSGWHYPSDVIVGAIMGSAVGYLIPVLHQKGKSEKINIAISGNLIDVKICF
jgi:hypothetical protein